MTAWWSARTRGQRLVIGVLGAVIAVNVALVALGAVVDQRPSGPSSSPIGTGTGGLAAYASLLEDHGHAVTVDTDSLTPADLPVDATAILVNPIRLSADDSKVLSAHLDAGGRLVVVGPDTAEILAAVTGNQVVARSTASVSRLHVWAPSAVTGRATSLAGDTGDRWASIGTLVPLAGDDDGGAFLVTGTVVGGGDGRIVGLAADWPLTNANLGRADNAALGLALVEAGRPAVFVDRTAAPSGSGLAAIPTPWKWTALALVVVVAAGLWAAGTRFGPPEPAARSLRPARREHVDAVAAGIARQGPPADPTAALDEGRRAAEAARRRHHHDPPPPPGASP